MDVTLLYVDGCPNWTKAAEVVRQALEEVGLSGEPVRLRRVETPQEAARLGFHGSPSVLVDGEDALDDPSAPVGLMCRVYPSDSGHAGWPTVAQVSAALRARI